MKISPETTAVLQNFSTINNSIQVKPGKRIRTISTNKTILASANVAEEFDVPFCIYDLSQFLGTLSLFDDPDLEFGENSVEIRAFATKLTYVYADPANVVLVPDKEVPCARDIALTLDADSLSKLQKAAAVIDLPNLVISQCENDHATFLVEVTDVKNPTPNTFRINVTADKVPESGFKAVLKIENLKFLPGPYKITISTKGVSKWIGPQAEYFVAIEASSSKF